MEIKVKSHLIIQLATKFIIFLIFLIAASLNDGLPTYEEVIAQSNTSSHSIVVLTENAIVTTTATPVHTTTTTTTITTLPS